MPSYQKVTKVLQMIDQSEGQLTRAGSNSLGQVRNFRTLFFEHPNRREG